MWPLLNHFSHLFTVYVYVDAGCCVWFVQHICFLFLTFFAWLCSCQQALSTSSRMTSFLTMHAHNSVVSYTRRIRESCCEFSAICSSMQLERDLLPNTVKNCSLQHCLNCATLTRNISRFEKTISGRVSCIIVRYHVNCFMGGYSGFSNINICPVKQNLTSDWEIA